MLLLLFVTVFGDFGYILIYMVIKETHMRLIILIQSKWRPLLMFPASYVSLETSVKVSICSELILLQFITDTLYNNTVYPFVFCLYSWIK